MTVRVPLSVLAGVLAAGLSLSAVAQTPASGAVEVHWTNPDDFAEVRYNPSGLGRAEPDEWLPQLARHVERRAGRAIAPGQRLDVTFTDIQRAGTYEPWRGPMWDDVRIVKDIYPPRIDLKFTLRNPDGSVAKEGTRELRDAAFLWRSTPNETDPLRYEKRLLDDWVRKEFPQPRG